VYNVLVREDEHVGIGDIPCHEHFINSSEERNLRFRILACVGLYDEGTRNFKCGICPGSCHSK